MPNYEVRAGENSGEVYIYDDIGESFFGGVSAKQIMDDLRALRSMVRIDVHLNSVGGNVFEGLAIHNALKNHRAKITVHVDGIAASIASVIAMAGDVITMPANAWMMIHDPWIMTGGTSADLRKVADDMDKVKDSLADTYHRRTGLDRLRVVDMMATETWMNGTEARDLGFADEVTETVAMAASANVNRYRFRHLPDAVAAPAPEALAVRQAVVSRGARIDSVRRLHALKKHAVISGG